MTTITIIINNKDHYNTYKKFQCVDIEYLAENNRL